MRVLLGKAGISGQKSDHPLQLPYLFLPALRDVIAQHYNFIFGQDSACVAAWCDHVASLAESASSQHQLVTVEGYLLEPALDAVHERLAGMADVTTVVARIRRHYYQWWDPGSYSGADPFRAGLDHPWRHQFLRALAAS